MRLVTHNFLKSNVKGATTGYPLTVEATELSTEDVEFDRDLILRLLEKIDYDVLREAAKALNAELPTEKASDDDDDFLKRVHHVLLEIHVVEGALVCPDTGRRYPITNGIPNMLLHEDELS